MTAPTDPIVFAPLRIEARAVRHGPLRAHVRRSGYGTRRATQSARELSTRRPTTVAVAGFAGGLHPDARPGDLVVATEVRDSAGAVPCPAAPILAGELRRAGLRVHEGPVLTVDRVVRDRQRTALAATGAIACDMESAPLVRAAGPSPVAVVRAIVDTPGHRWAHLDTPRAVWAALKALRAAVPVLATWSAATAPRTALLAEPRSFCAGVERAVAVVARALDRYEAPIYVRKQIAHNSHVVRDLERRGAVFVDDLDEVPDGATLIYSAHGVAPTVRRAAAERGLRVIDATCPLVAATHTEARRFADRGDTIALIGQAGHEEIDGILGQAPDHTVLVESVDDVVALPTDRPISYLTQTTLVADEAERITNALLDKFPDAEGPAPEHRCYAMTHRQDALRAVAGDADVVLVAGSPNSSNAQRLVELVERGGTPAHLIDGPGDIHLDWLAAASAVGVTAGASTPPDVVDAVLGALRGLGPVEVTERRVATESVRFTLPKEVRSS